jgi:excisionase family DNA binding protein
MKEFSRECNDTQKEASVKKSDESRGRLLTVVEAAAALGLKPCTVRAWIGRRKLPVVQLSARCLRVPEGAIHELVSKHFVPSREAQ